jgi:hypothetical protein
VIELVQNDAFAPHPIRRQLIPIQELFTRCSTPVFLQCTKGTVSPGYKCLEVLSVKSPWFGQVTPDEKNLLTLSSILMGL